MQKSLSPLLLLLFLQGFSNPAIAQVDEDQLGAWYMFMWTADPEIGAGFGLQGDVQHRNWDAYGDLEQLLIRGGLTWSPQDSNLKFTLGLAHISSGAFGPSRDKTREKRLYQELLIPQRVSDRFYLTHRLRLEQRDVDNQDFRNRFRYSFALNYPLNQTTLSRGALYLSFYNELFLNLEQDVGNNRRVDYFDRNRFYAAIGYSLSDSSRLQFGYMEQTLDEISKGQLQFNWLHSF